MTIGTRVRATNVTKGNTSGVVVGTPPGWRSRPPGVVFVLFDHLATPCPWDIDFLVPE